MKFINIIVLSLMLTSISFFSNATLINDASGSSFRDDWTGVVGINFQVNGGNIDINALGFEDLGLDGLEKTQEVGIWDNTGTLLDFVNIPSSLGGILVGNWRYTILSDTITLLDGYSYTIGALVDNGNGNGWTDGGVTSLFSFDSSVMGSGFVNVYNSGTSLTLPTSNGNGADLRWAPANATFIAVPEPSTLAIFGLGLIGLVSLRFKKQS